MDLEYSFWDHLMQDVPVVKSLQENWKQIRDEVRDLTNGDGFLFDYPKWDIPKGVKGVTELYENYWKVCPLSGFEHENTYNLMTDAQKSIVLNIIKSAKKRCPVIEGCISELEQEGNLSSAFISRLVPGSKINPHRGFTRDWMRTHLGLICDDKCAITVNGETKVWQEGKILAFRDGDIHSVFHDGTQERIVFSVDIKLSYLQPFILRNVT